MAPLRHKRSKKNFKTKSKIDLILFLNSDLNKFFQILKKKKNLPQEHLLVLYSVSNVSINHRSDMKTQVFFSSCLQIFVFLQFGLQESSIFLSRYFQSPERKKKLKKKKNWRFLPILFNQIIFSKFYLSSTFKLFPVPETC